MALNFPADPTNGDTYTEANTTWKYDGTVWNVVQSDTARTIFTTVAGDTGSATADIVDDTITIEGGTNVTTSVAGKTLTINSSGATQNLFATVTSDDGSTTADNATDTLSILGGTNIATNIATDTDNVTVNMTAFSIDFLSDVDTTSTSPVTGNVLKWNGTNWAPGADATTGGAGTDADTLDGFDSSYFLDYGNFTNTPSVVSLDSFSIGNELAASGNGAISYDDSTGVFRYTPPDLSSYLTSVSFADLASTPTTVAGYGITDAQSTLVSGTNIKTINGTTLLGSGDISISGGDGGGISLTDLSVGAEGTASGNGAIAYDNTSGEFTYIPPVIPSVLTDLGISDGSNGQVLTTNGAGTFSFTTVSSSSSTFSSLTEASTASLTIDKIYEPAIAMLRVDNVSATAYTFNSHYSGNNPTLYAFSGTTIAFDLDAIPGHPFEIQDATRNAYDTGLVHVSSDGTVSTGSNAQGKSSGTLYWRIPESISGNYGYQCQAHSSMFGVIVIKRLSTI